jgi:hypothetical protein
MPGYIYASDEDAIYVNLFVTSEADIHIQDAVIRIEQKSNYPWEGKIQIEVSPPQEEEFGLLVRIPGWAQNRPVPGDLYRYLGIYEGKPALSVNGESTPLEVVHGYASIHRVWKEGDVVLLDLPMPVRLVQSHPDVVENTGKIALERGPLVYCVEGIDHGGKALDLVMLEDPEVYTEFYTDLLQGLVAIKGRVLQNGNVRELKAIPYYAWSHRGVGEMTVWLDQKR